MAEPISAAAVANAFLDIQDADPSDFPRIDAMKLQKLLYYAHAWWLGFNGEPLFRDEIYAWPWGPVVPDIYGKFRRFGRKPIVGDRATELVKVGNSFLNYRAKKPDEPDGEIMEFLKKVWESHKNLTGIQLSNSTHAPGEPWAVVKDQYGDLETRPVIPNGLIRDVFQRKLAQ